MIGQVRSSLDRVDGATLGGVGISLFIEDYVSMHRYTDSSQLVGRKILGRFAREVGDCEPQELTEAHIVGWWRTISAKAAAASLRAYHSTVRGFLRWLRLPNLMDGISRPRAPRSSPRTLSAEEIDRLRTSCHNLRDRSIIELGHGIGLRAMEVATLQVPDIDWNRRKLYIHSKGGHRDELPLHQRVAWVLEEYFDECPPSATGFVIRNRHNNTRGLTPTYVTQRVADISYRAGVKKAPLDGRGMHGLRRTFATELHDAGVPIRDIQKLLRHQSLAPTERYIRDSSQDDLLRALDKRAEATR